EDRVRLEALKTYREFAGSGEAAATAREVLALRREALKAAQGPAAQKAAVEELMKAEIESIKAELGQRQGYSQLMRALGREEALCARPGGSAGATVDHSPPGASHNPTPRE
ncbi:MAG: hypothetical protein L0Z62_31250, partial [Gemmataceae bacterium]|nr:hypothetical protein [Gemmataceae bacterium]